MKSVTPLPQTLRALVQRTPSLAAAASLLLSTGLHAQTAADKGAESKAPSSLEELPPNHPLRETLRSIKFEGGSTTKLCDLLREEFPADNIVLGPSTEHFGLPGFELRNVRLPEIARTIEFLSEGKLGVEVAVNAGAGNIWRIGWKTASGPVATSKMRSVAAPRLLADDEKLQNVLNVAQDVEYRRAENALESGAKESGFKMTKATPLKDQGVLFLIGDEDGVAGVESLIKAAEQRLAEDAAIRNARFAANAPNMRAVAAPHQFAELSRWKALEKELDHMKGMWRDLNMELREEMGSERAHVIGVEIEPRPEQKVFLLWGSEPAIAGLESLIQSAERLAAEEDAKLQLEKEAMRDQGQAVEAAERAKSEKREH